MDKIVDYCQRKYVQGQTTLKRGMKRNSRIIPHSSTPETAILLSCIFINLGYLLF